MIPFWQVLCCVAELLERIQVGQSCQLWTLNHVWISHLVVSYRDLYEARMLPSKKDEWWWVIKFTHIIRLHCKSPNPRIRRFLFKDLLFSAKTFSFSMAGSPRVCKARSKKAEGRGGETLMTNGQRTCESDPWQEKTEKPAAKAAVKEAPWGRWS